MLVGVISSADTLSRARELEKKLSQLQTSVTHAGGKLSGMENNNTYPGKGWDSDFSSEAKQLGHWPSSSRRWCRGAQTSP